MTEKSLHILKFGGSSLYDAEKIKRAVSIVAERIKTNKVAVVVSALGGVTDELLQLAEKAQTGARSLEADFILLEKRHIGILNELLGQKASAAERSQLQELLNDLKGHLQKVSQIKEITPSQRDLIISYGERASGAIFAAVLRSYELEAQLYESQNLVRTNGNFGEADVDSPATIRLINNLLGNMNGNTPVITGFIGSTNENIITTLGRSGSDYTAGLIGEALNAERVEIWTDVNGVLTADPDIAPTAVTIPHLHYSEIAEMAHFGTKVLHPRTVLPLELLRIPIHIKNSFYPENPGTLISNEFPSTNGRLRSVSVKKDIVLVGIKSKGLDRIKKLSSRVLNALSEADIAILFNASAASDYGISLVINASQKHKAELALSDAFQSEFTLGTLEKPLFYEEVNMVTVIGESLKKDLGLSGAVLSVLGENNIAPLATARGVDNRHLSLLVQRDQTHMTARLINDHFCIHSRQLRLFVAGTGTIGGEFFRQTNELRDQNIDLSIIGICNSKETVWNPAGIKEGDINFSKTGTPTNWDAIVDHLIQEYPYRTVFIDATGSGDVARLYDRLLEAGIHIATPSKRAVTFEQSYFEKLTRFTEGNKTHFFFETAVGAGLPVLQTLRDLQASGDKITKISGVVSGTMTYIFGQLEQGKSFGQAIRNAKDFGYSEPDPRDDLSGEDVARKFMILARASGYQIERDEVVVEDLTPHELSDMNTDTFLERISEFDEEWKLKVDQASKKGKVLRYVGEMSEGNIKIETQAVPRESPLGSLRGADNQIIIHTKRYNESPIIIQGPGAGKEVTAAGVLSDVQKIGRLIFD
ncbi:MAG: bifunctional aspartate kinase/homoserine dehydrogenase I [Balneolales bacterium]